MGIYNLAVVFLGNNLPNNWMETNRIFILQNFSKSFRRNRSHCKKELEIKLWNQI